MKGNKMKKLFVLLVLAMFITACPSKEEAKPDTEVKKEEVKVDVKVEKKQEVEKKKKDK